MGVASIFTQGQRQFETVRDVVFAGHYEKDGRLECLEALAGKHRLNLFGGGWNRASISEQSTLRSSLPVHVLLGSEYRLALSGAKIALCFLSTLNKDTYTRRNFEIPAMETFMLSQYTEDLAGLYQEGVEAEFFRSKEELLDKTDFYLKNESSRTRIAHAGFERLKRDGHDVTSRMKSFLAQLSKL